MFYKFYPFKTITVSGPLIVFRLFNDTKDPSPVFDGTLWNLYGSGGSSASEAWQILHAASKNLHCPWKPLGKILSHEEVSFYNAKNHPDYECWLEESQIIELPDGNIFLVAVCFLIEGVRGTR